MHIYIIASELRNYYFALTNKIIKFATCYSTKKEDYKVFLTAIIDKTIYALMRDANHVHIGKEIKQLCAFH